MRFAGRQSQFHEWLESEIAHRGVRENAAVLAAVESLPSVAAEQVARAYVERYPDRRGVLDALRSAVVRDDQR